MSKLLSATYQNGSLILDEKLDSALEGKKLTLMLVEIDLSNLNLHLLSATAGLKN